MRRSYGPSLHSLGVRSVRAVVIPVEGESDFHNDVKDTTSSLTLKDPRRLESILSSLYVTFTFIKRKVHVSTHKSPSEVSKAFETVPCAHQKPFISNEIKSLSSRGRSSFCWVGIP